MSVEVIESELKTLSFCNSCRTCLKFLTGDETQQYQIFEYCLDETPLKDALKSICQLEVEEDDCLPPAICVSCLSRLCDAYNFMKTCKNSDKILRGSTKKSVAIRKIQEVYIEEENNGQTHENEEKPHICLICNKSFSQISFLRKHHQSRHPNSSFIKTESFKCEFCQKEFITRQSLVHHINLNHEGKHKRHMCETCGKGFSQIAGLKNHQNIHEGFKPYTCEYCSKSFTQISQLNVHLRTHTGEKPYKCEYCEKSFTVGSNLNVHTRRMHTGEVPFPCDICERAFPCTSSLKKHKESHKTGKVNKTLKASESSSLVCEICGKEFKLRTSLRVHKFTHTGEKPHKCDVCEKTFTQYPHLVVHIRTHTGEKPYKCDNCGKQFNVKSNLRVHLRKHTGEKPYQCSICLKSFALSCNLRKHERTHNIDPTSNDGVPGAFIVKTDNDQQVICEIKVLDEKNVKPHQCAVCGKTFTQSPHLKIHMRSHTGEKPYKCEYCNKKFSVMSNWKVHTRRHTGETRFECDICSKPFYDTGDLTRHRKIHKNDETVFDTKAAATITDPIAFLNNLNLSPTMLLSDGSQDDVLNSK